MKQKELKNQLSHLRVGHLYIKDILLSQISDYKDQFLKYNMFDYSNTQANLSTYDILLIEFQTLNKENFKFLNNIVKKYTSKEIYIFSVGCDNTFLLKFALHFSLNKIHSLKINIDDFEKLLFDMSKKYLHSHADKTQVEISKKINSIFSLLIFQDGSLIFANEKVKKLFSTQKLSDIENVVKNDENIYELLNCNHSNSSKIAMTNSDGELWDYSFYCDVFDDSNEKLLTIIPLNKREETDAFLSKINRFKFIEILKDKLAQNSVNKTPMSLITITISNYDKLISSSGSIAVHDFVKKFISKLCLYKNSCQDLTQWSPHFFIFLIEGESFENVKEELDSMHQQLIYCDIDDNISPIITSSALRIDSLEINDVIHCAEEINSRTFKYNDFNDGDYFELNHLNDYVDENEQIHHYLQSCIGTKTSLKLLNIYKGLCINTASKVLKINESSYYFHCENLQGYSMKFENKTTIQTPDLQKDIQADIVYVNIEKSYAILDNLVFLNASANNRQHTRVQPSMRTPISIKYGKYSFQGEIMDISTKSIALKLNHSLDESISSKQVGIKFKVPDSSSEEGFSVIDIDAKVVHIGSIDLTKCKVVVMLNLKKPYDSYLLKYMYDRQKELILELKRAIKVHNK